MIIHSITYLDSDGEPYLPILFKTQEAIDAYQTEIEEAVEEVRRLETIMSHSPREKYEDALLRFSQACEAFFERFRVSWYAAREGDGWTGARVIHDSWAPQKWGTE